MTSMKINVCVKIRPVYDQGLKKIKRQWKTEDNKSVSQIDCPNVNFRFDHVYDENVSIKDMFENYGKPIVHSALNGINGTILVYGPKLSGKTYSLHGAKNDPGIIYLAIQKLINSIKNSKDRIYLIRVSYFEIYNEHINDLFDEKKLCKINLNEKDDVTVSCKEYVVNNVEEILKHFDYGNSQRRLNNQSNNSHTIFRIIIESHTSIEKFDDKNGILTSILSFVDLTERPDELKLNSSTKNKNKNYSLVSLTKLVDQLSEHAQSINYRDSKLTRILQASLGGNCETAAICTIDPTQTKETYVTLNFGSRLKLITNKPLVNIEHSERLLTKLLKKEINFFYEALETELLKNNPHEIERLKEKIYLSESQFIPFKETLSPNNNQCLDLDIVPLTDEKRKYCDFNINNIDQKLILTPLTFKLKKQQYSRESLDSNMWMLKCKELENELKELKDFTRLENNINSELNLEENTDVISNDKLEIELVATKNDLDIFKNKNQELEQTIIKIKKENELEMEKHKDYNQRLQYYLKNMYLCLKTVHNNDDITENIKAINNMLENFKEFNLDLTDDKSSSITSNAYLLQIENKILLNKINNANKQIESFEDELNNERNNFEVDVNELKIELKALKKENEKLKKEMVNWELKYDVIKTENKEMNNEIQEMQKNKIKMEKSIIIVESDLENGLQKDNAKIKELNSQIFTMEELNSSLTKEMITFEKKLMDMKNQLISEQTNFESYQRRQETLNNFKDEEINDLRNEKEILENSLMKITEEYDVLKPSIQKLEEMFLNLNDQKPLEQNLKDIIQDNHINKLKLLNENIDKFNNECLVRRIQSVQSNSNANNLKANNISKQQYNNKESHMVIRKLVGENNDLKQKNKHLTIEMDDLRTSIKNDRKSRRQSAHDEKRQLWDNREVGIMTEPTDEKCGCQEMNSKIIELKREIIIKDSHINMIQLMNKNNSFNDENKELKDTLTTYEHEMQEIKIDNDTLRKGYYSLEVKCNSMKNAIISLKEKAAQSENENYKIEIVQQELVDFKNKYYKLNNILSSKNNQEKNYVPLQKENELQEKYSILKQICLKRKQ